ncbi:MAG: acyltransferase [Hyphomonadaceae bacterium]|nr:acyltransferase [Hyphomonadaceae bacterium]
MLLDALRGVAAFAVVWGHLGDTWGHPVGQLFILAVDFFFILSGFVMAHAYKHKLASTMSPPAFFRVRIVRLYPLLVFGAVLGALAMVTLMGGDQGYDGWRIAASAGLAILALPTFLIHATAEAFPVNPPAWSLFFELIANAVYGFISRFLTRNRLIFLTLLAAVMLVADALHRGTIESGWAQTELAGGLIRVFFGFTCGLLLYEIRPKWRLSQVWGWALMAALAAVLFVPIHGWAKAQLVTAVFIMPAIVWFGSAAESPGALGKFSLFLGALSYPLYITHRPILEMTTAVFQRFAPDVDYRIWEAVQIVLFVAFAWAALKLFDEPVRAWLQKIMRRPPPRPATV